MHQSVSSTIGMYNHSIVSMHKQSVCVYTLCKQKVATSIEVHLCTCCCMNRHVHSDSLSHVLKDNQPLCTVNTMAVAMC